MERGFLPTRRAPMQNLHLPFLCGSEPCMLTMNPTSVLSAAISAISCSLFTMRDLPMCNQFICFLFLPCTWSIHVSFYFYFSHLVAPQLYLCCKHVDIFVIFFLLNDLVLFIANESAKNVIDTCGDPLFF